MNPGNIPGRQSNYYPLQPATSNIINGTQATSPSSLYSNINKSYCFVTITATRCSSYGNGGTKTYIWDSSNDGNSYDAAMNITVPSDSQFTITIDYHESCGPYYTNFAYKRAMWIHQRTYSPASAINVSSWTYNRVDNC